MQFYDISETAEEKYFSSKTWITNYTGTDHTEQIIKVIKYLLTIEKRHTSYLFILEFFLTFLGQKISKVLNLEKFNLGKSISEERIRELRREQNCAVI